MVKGILKELNRPLVCTSANISGEKSPKGFLKYLKTEKF
jgi:tRNA A37 threonylcarbamoyladenosine synthetase subunit TsaC/SUA5/YrdC